MHRGPCKQNIKPNHLWGIADLDNFFFFRRASDEPDTNR